MLQPKTLQPDMRTHSCPQIVFLMCWLSDYLSKIFLYYSLFSPCIILFCQPEGCISSFLTLSSFYFWGKECLCLWLWFQTSTWRAHWEMHVRSVTLCWTQKKLVPQKCQNNLQICGSYVHGCDSGTGHECITWQHKNTYFCFVSFGGESKRVMECMFSTCCCQNESTQESISLWIKFP